MYASGPMTRKWEYILKSKFQTGITFALVLLMNQNLKKNVEYSLFLIIKTLCPLEFEIFEI